MDFKALIGGKPKDWIANHGKPAAVFWSHAENMAAYEDERKKVVVMECLEVLWLISGFLQLRPFSYHLACLGAPKGLVHLHLQKQDVTYIDIKEREADLKEVSLPPPNKWRPIIREINGTSIANWTTFGSQWELALRDDIYKAFEAKLDKKSLEEVTEILEAKSDAELKALKLLKEHLTAMQRLELAATSSFRVIGARTKNHYRITLGDGFDVVDKVTGKCVISYCFHPEYYMPDADIALATMLELEDPELEEDILKIAKLGSYVKGPKRTKNDWHAYRLERELNAT